MDIVLGLIRKFLFIAVVAFSAVLYAENFATTPGELMVSPELAGQIGGQVLVGNEDPRRVRETQPLMHAQLGLFSCDGKFIDGAMTDANGDYLFNDVASGCYRVRIRTADYYRLLNLDHLGFFSGQAWMDPTTGTSSTVELEDGERALYFNVNVDDPIPAEIGDRVWKDLNANGIQDIDEPGLAGVQIALRSCDGHPVYDADGILRTVTTNETGEYLFSGLKPDCYTVEYVVPKSFRVSPLHIGNSSTDSDAHEYSGQIQSPTIEISSRNDSEYHIDGGFFQHAKVGNRVWMDTNGDGIQSTDEPGYAGVNVILLDEFGIPTSATTKTDSRGSYVFDNVKPGRYMLQFVIPGGLTASPSNQGGNASLDSDANAKGVTPHFELTSADERVDMDFGVRLGDGLAISIEKSTNGIDADTPPGPFILAGDPVTWVYDVFNSGSEELFFIEVMDDQGVEVTCPETMLNPGVGMTCFGADGVAVEGQYVNTATTSGNDGSDDPLTVEDEDSSHYFGAVPAVSIEKSTNGVDADTPPGPNVQVGSIVDFVYLVTNDGNVELTNILVTDNQGVNVICPSDTLPAGESMQCSGAATAVPGQYVNIGTASGDAPVGPRLTDSDPSHYFGEDGALDLEKFTNGVNADNAPGPYIAFGDAVEWTYVVTNNSNVVVTSVSVSDSQDVAVTCPVITLAPGATTTCTAFGTATPGQYMNIGTVMGNTPAGGQLSASDPSHYFGVDGTLDLEKTTNGEDADSAPGPYISVGGAVNWTYVVTNNSNVTVTNLSVSDSQGVNVTCPVTTLAPGATTTCTASGTATAGQYMNLGTATGTTPSGGQLSGTDPSHYFGEDGTLDIEKSTNGVDADNAPGPSIALGSPVNWTYAVTNNSNVTVTNLSVSDSQGVNVICPVTTLAPGATTTCTASGTATAGQYMNLGTATGTTPSGGQLSGTDPSHYFGEDGTLDIEKFTNGVNADNAPGPYIPVGDNVAWTYVVTNNSNVEITSVSVSDSQDVTVTCPVTTLAPGATTTCTATGTATTGQYMNIGTVMGNTPGGGRLSANDPSHYFGLAGTLDIEKSTNGIDADNAPGPSIALGATVNWTYWVTNNSNVEVTNLNVTDSQGVNVSCPVTTLAPGASTTCTASGTATAGQYMNLGTATGTTPGGGQLSGTDPSHYFGEDGTLDIEKSTNGVDADNAPGPSIALGSTVNWTYVVTNNSNITVTNLSVIDSQGVTVTCPVTTLAPGASTTCTASGLATAGQYMNLGTATGTTPGGGQLSGTDPSHYFGEDGTLDIEKSTNGVDADSAPGPSIALGSPVNWTYVVTNNSNVTVTNLSVSDSQGVTVTCPVTTLAPGASTTCTASGLATAGQYMNLGTVTGTTPSSGQLGGTDPSHYFGEDGTLDIEKSTNGVDADSAPGPSIALGSTVNWTYVVTNNSNITVTNLSVIDSQGVTVTCPVTTLAPGASTTCTASGLATAGQYMNLGTATGTTPGGGQLSGTDPSHYFGEDGTLDIEKSTNGVDADNAPGPSIALGSTVNWTYVVTNNSNVTVTNLSVIDSQGVPVTCPATTLAPGASTACTASGLATAGQYMNLGTVTGTTPSGGQLSGTDPSHYFGEDGTLDIEKSTNGVDADSAPGPSITAGATVNWTYTVTNNSNVIVTGLTVSDSQGVSVTCPVTALAPGATTTCTASGVATAGQYMNLGTVTGTTPGGGQLTGTDPSHYFGEDGTLDIEKSTNGEDADNAPGPSINVGDAVVWEYSVTNNSNVDVDNLVVTDSQGVSVSCPVTTLAAGAATVCTASGIATAGQYMNLGTVTGITPGGVVLTGSDPSHYFGLSQCEIAVNKTCAVIVPASGNLSCEAKIAATRLRYIGPTVYGATVIFDGGDGFAQYTNVDLVSGVTVLQNASGYSVDAGTDDDLGSKMSVYINGVREKHHTSCSTPYTANAPAPLNQPLGAPSALWFVESFRDKHGNVVVAQDPDPVFLEKCSVDVASGVLCKKRPTEISLRYNGGDCAQSTTIQPDSSWSCAGDAGTSELVRIVMSSGSRIYVDQSGVNIGDVIVASEGGDDFDSNAEVTVYDSTGGVLQHIELHTSCSKPLRLGDRFGSVQIAGYVNSEQGSVQSGAHVIYKYEVSNIGTVAVSNISVNDDSLSPSEVPGSPIATLLVPPGPGDTVTLMTSVFVDAAVNSTVTVEGESSGALCYAEDELLVNTGTGPDPDPECVVASAPDHGFWLANFSGTNQVERFDFDAGATFEQFDDGTARLTGTIRRQGMHDLAFEVDIDLSGRTDIPPPGSPKNTFGANVADWEYFPDWSGTLTGAESYAGAQVMLTRTGPSFQIGTGGNDQPGEQNVYGGSAWLDFAVQTQSHSCINQGQLCIADHGFGDINVRINCVNNPACDAGSGGIELKDREIKWELINNGSDSLHIESITVGWPSQHKDLKEVKFDGKIFDSDRSGPSLTLGPSDWMGNAEKRLLKPGETRRLTVKFEKDYKDATQQDYNLQVAFDAGCTVVFVPGSGTFECDKPIELIAMTWDGSEAVRVKAYKGGLGDQLLADIDNIAIGDDLAVSGLSGSPNDVFWEVFEAGTSNKIGESKFHLSCSDDDMDGEEDCGKREGNGKDNNGNFINNWLLDGMVDQSGTLDCTP